jgi:23S rRNA C2498 (ribose-2'-O)-methylase RlmM
MLGREALGDLFLDIPLKDNAKFLIRFCRLVTVDLHSQVRDLGTPINRGPRFVFNRCADVL